MYEKHDIQIGISACLLGEKVRYDGGHKLQNYIHDTLGEFFSFKTFCPEMDIGLGAPRETIRLIQKQDNDQVAHLIRTVMTEFRAVGAGYSIGDSEVDDMYGHYRDKRSCYYVITSGDQVVGCGGLGPLEGGNKFTCELQKMFLRPEARGIGLGQQLLLLLLDDARTRDYKKCYLETLDRMYQANELYQKNEFELLDKPMGMTGHDSCDRWYLLHL